MIGVYHERRAADAVRALMRLVVPRCRVVRDGHEWDIDSRELVPGMSCCWNPAAGCQPIFGYPR
ncbi:hypothetical protein [Candidatus Mycolicibacterium alkanivorans]|uniref:Uncharacterized protein n=1 Tax=Candidatus Mycolicibacterium alkanivorans TaxID=2954114 RepID=A0ABS9YUS3_9MYCO|nr:hypothetical protein [Candidatus Mycolicibacterium alkanivorans]MCI4674995.1 hypothetical protein [Candidatus Mycolicibacterium alkanivorans]